LNDVSKTVKLNDLQFGLYYENAAHQLRNVIKMQENNFTKAQKRYTANCTKADTPNTCYSLA